MTTHGIIIELDQNIVEVGEHLTGRILRQPDADGLTAKSKARELRLSLQYETSGRGTTDSKSVSTQRFDCDIQGGVNASFSLAVPDEGPISYDGSLIRVRWSIEARLDLKLARDPKHDVSVLVIPRNGSAVYNSPHPLRQ